MTTQARRRVAWAAAVGAFLVAVGTPSFAADDAPAIQDLTPIKASVDFPVGVAIDSRETRGAPAALLLRHFSQITPENAMKPEAWYDASHQFAPRDEIATLMDFAAANDLRVYGHVLVWHNQTPLWFFEHDDGSPLTNSPEDQRLLATRLHDHIFSVAKYLSDNWGPFGGGNPIVAFDVVNETVSDDGGTDDGLRATRWYQVLGEDYIDLAFRDADEAFNRAYADPGAESPVTLFINDYNTEDAAKRARYLALVDRLLARGVPVGGVGHQFHVDIGTNVDGLGDALDDAGGRGLVQAVTELDVTTGTPTSARRFALQSEFYRDAFRIFRAHSDELFSVTLWGLYDARSWLDSRGGPLPFDDALQAKPAYYGIVDGYGGEPRLEDLPAPASDGGGRWLLVAGIAALLATGLWTWWRDRNRRSRARRAGAVRREVTVEDALDALNRQLPQRAQKKRGRP